MAAVLLATCDGPSAPDAGEDAGHDAGRDAGSDAGHDAGPRDAGHDAGHDAGPSDPGWAPWVTLEACTFERAERPEAVLRVDWEPCDLVPSCLRPIQRGLNTSRGWFDGGEGFFQVTSIDDSRRATLALVAVSGRTLAAWRYFLRRGEDVCLFDLGVGDGTIAIVPGYFDGTLSGRSIEHVFHGPLAALDEMVAPVAIVSPGVQPQTVAVSADVIAFWTGAWAVAVDPATGRVVYLNEPLEGIPQNVTVVGPHVLWEDWADLVRVAHADLGTAASLFHRADPGDVKGFGTDGVDLAWFEGYDRQPDGHYARLELWTAPYTRDPAALAPRRVRDMDLRGGSMYGGGWYLVRRGASAGYDIVDVRDGSLRRLESGGSTLPLYVSEREIMFGSMRFDPHELPVAD
ncbi:MAG: hypothetical protein KF729_00470 [Sandaracinaceae bacterium]|nr:hypothetical protein [Sandaracinaceae bacterium]